MRGDSIKVIPEISFLIFDFDGVLISVSQSYREAIRETAHYYFAKILGIETPDDLVTVEDVQKFKDVHLFNNDWTLTYALIQYFLSLTLIELRRRSGIDRFALNFDKVNQLGQLLSTLAALGEDLKRYGIRPDPRWKAEPTHGLDEYLDRISALGKSGVKVSIIETLSWLSDIEKAVSRKLAPYEDEIDLVKRLFEEIYLGGKLFTKFYREDPVFVLGPGYIENEKLIPTMDTLNGLKERFGRFGIYSEKPREQGLYALNIHGIARFFLPETTTFQEDMGANAVNSSDAGKPNPEALLKLLKARHAPGYTAYIGDTVSDAALVNNVRSSGFGELLFIGTYASSADPTNLISKYRDLGADVIVEDVNALLEVVMIETT